MAIHDLRPERHTTLKKTHQKKTKNRARQTIVKKGES